MPYCSRTLSISVLGVALAAALLNLSPAAAQQQSANDMVNLLLPKPTRSIGVDPKTIEQCRIIDNVRGVPTRSISVEAANQLADCAKSKPSIDLEVHFDYNSAVIGAEATDALTNLGMALRDPRLKGALVMLAGHTDAKGGDAYNKDLSDHRAEAVRHFLVEKFSLPAANLIAIGYGKSRLKNTADPFAAENRRVQVVNMLAQ